MMWALVAQLAMWEPVRPPVLHQGSWQSCDNAERVLQHSVLGHVVWELHLGPGNEFALFNHEVPDEEDEHSSKENLLAPDMWVTSDGTWRGKRNWNIPSLRLWVSITAAGGSREECQSFYVRVESTQGRKAF